MVEIRSDLGDFFVFDPETELISKNGVIVPYSEYQPVFVRNSINNDSILPTFVGILNKSNNTIISSNGNVNKLIDSDNEIDI